MRNYLDPVYLFITEKAWYDRVYLNDIFESFNAILNEIKEVEISTNTRYQLVKFKMSEDLFAQIYSNNPFKNEPQIQAFYTKLFNDILSDFIKRVEWCPSSSCLPFHKNIPGFKFENDSIPNEVLIEWNKLLSNCLSCDSNDLLLYLLTPERHQTVITGKSDFIKITPYVVQLFEIPHFLSEEIISETSLRTAIDILYQQRIITDNWEATRQAQDYVFDDFFWETIKNKQLVDEDDEYKERFINSLAQVIYDIDVNIRKHKYGKIKIDHKEYLKYSVDIFKMGRGTNDNRCSRIFYYKVKSVIHFYEYNPDYH
jgi:hypothetical protein